MRRACEANTRAIAKQHILAVHVSLVFNSHLANCMVIVCIVRFYYGKAQTAEHILHHHPK